MVRNRGWLIALGLLIGGALISYVGITALARPTLATSTGPGPIAASQPQPSSTLSPSSLTLTVLHTNDTWGYTQPCG
ncbi:MAG: hypothetical protein WBW48_16940 [Anaerolineae bacterium]